MFSHAPIFAHFLQNLCSSVHWYAKTMELCKSKAQIKLRDIIANISPIARVSSQMLGHNPVDYQSIYIYRFPNTQAKIKAFSTNQAIKILFLSNQSNVSTSMKVKRCCSSLGSSETFLMKTSAPDCSSCKDLATSLPGELPCVKHWERKHQCVSKTQLLQSQH